MIKEALPPKIGNIYTSWNIDLLYCNLIGSYPALSNDLSQDLIQRHGMQLLQLRENKKFRKYFFLSNENKNKLNIIIVDMDRCTKLEEMCSNWILKPKIFIAVS